MPNDELLRLADRVEALTGPDREVDVDIHEALGNLVDRGCPADWHSEEETPEYTSSLDAAMQLVPEGCGWLVAFGRTRPDEPYGGAEIVCNADGDGPQDKLSEAEAATPALALTAAALRAARKALGAAG